MDAIFFTRCFFSVFGVAAAVIQFQGHFFFLSFSIEHNQ